MPGTLGSTHVPARTSSKQYVEYMEGTLVRAEPSKMKAGIENEVPQRQIETELDMPITQEEITKAIAKRGT